MNRHASVDPAPPLSRNERRRQRTRAQLLAAAEVLLVEIGYDALTVQDITDEADLARATFYIHFVDKEAAVWAVLEQRFAALVDVLMALEESDPRRRRYRKWQMLFEYVAENRQMVAMLLGEKGHIKLLQRLVGLMAATLEADLVDGRVERTTDLPAAFEANFYAGAVLQTITWWLENDCIYTPQELANMLTAIVYREPY